MTDRRFPGVSKYQDRHGTWRWRARAKGKPQKALPGPYGSPEFIRAWEEWANDAPASRVSSRTLPGTISALLSAYYQSPEFNYELADTTRKAYRATLERFRAKNGDKPYTAITRANIVAIRDKLRPDPSNIMLRALRHMSRYAVDRGVFQSDPTAGLRKIKIKTDGIHTWSLEEVARFEAFHPVGTKPRLAMALLLYTAQRRSDVVQMGRQLEIDGGCALRLRQRKTGEWLVLPIVAPLRQILEAGPTGAMNYLETAHGKPFSSAGFGNWFAKQCSAAGLKGCSAHGLRKAAATRLAMAGATAHEIQSITGHRTLSEVQRYTRGVDQKRLAEGVAGALAGTDAGQVVGDPLPGSPIKPVKSAQ